MLNGFPTSLGPERDTWILDAVSGGRAQFGYAPIDVSDGGNEATLLVFDDALRIDGVRVTVDAELQQSIADLLGCCLLTPHIADLIFQARTLTCTPNFLPSDGQMASPERMIRHSDLVQQQVDSQVAKGASPTLVSTVGKHWVLTNKIAGKTLGGAPMAANYGWNFMGNSFQGIKGEASSIPGIRVIQGLGTKHNAAHVDYSQTCVLVNRRVRVNGQEGDLRDVLTDPSLAGLVSTEGPLKIVRQPGVPELASLTGDGPTGNSPDGGTEDSFLRKLAKGAAVAGTLTLAALGLRELVRG